MSLKSLINTGTKVWLDGVEPDQIKSNRALGITGATSNPTIISHIIIETGKFDQRIVALIGQGQVGIVTAKQVWRSNHEFWKDKHLRLHQELVFVSTGVKDPSEPVDKYVDALAGSDIQTNPPATNDAVQCRDNPYTRKIDQPLNEDVVKEIGKKADKLKLERADGRGREEIRGSAKASFEEDRRQARNT